MKDTTEPYRVLIVGNRFTSNMDVLNNDAYRTFKISDALKAQGIETKTWLINYTQGQSHFESNIFSPAIFSKSIFHNRKLLIREVEKFRPTHIWFTNGPIVAFLASLLYPAINKNKKIYEVLDNYATYYPKFLFPLSIFDRWIRKSASFCLYVSSELLQKDSLPAPRKHIFPNGFDPLLFRPLPQADCREKLKLAQNERLIGFTGSLDERVLQNLKDLIEISERKNSQYKFVIASNSKPTDDICNSDNVYWLGQKKITEIPNIINACDVMIIPNRMDPFTKYCFPSKLMEYIGCQKPFLVTPINSFNNIVPYDNIGDFNMEKFFERIEVLMATPKTISNHKAFTWQSLISSITKHF